MAVASDFLIGGNDEHGLNPPTAGKRTPIMPYINRSFYENEFNRQAKIDFLLACLRCGFNVYDVHPEVQDTSVSTRVVRANRAGLTLLVTFAYNAFGAGVNFNSAQGIEVYYSPFNIYSNESRILSEEVYEKLVQYTGRVGRFVGQLSVGVLSNVNCPSTLIEAGFMTNFAEAKTMVNPNFVVAVGEAACQGVCEYLGVPYLDRTLNNYPTLRQGNQGNKVRMLQIYLNEYGYGLTVDGIFGVGTLSAVKDFQNKNGLTIDGVVGPRTWQALLNINIEKTLLKRGSRSSAVWYLQKLLLSFLYPITDIDGVFGPQTEAQVREFQRENALSVDGVVGPKTWEVLLTSVGRPNPN